MRKPTRSGRILLYNDFDAAVGKQLTRGVSKTIDFVQPRLEFGSMAIVAVGSAFAGTHINSRLDAADFGGTTTDQLSGWFQFGEQLLNPVEAIKDPLAHARLIVNPTREFDRRSAERAREYSQIIVEESLGIMSIYANSPDIRDARGRVQQGFVDLHALENGENLSRSQVREQTNGFLELYRN